MAAFKARTTIAPAASRRERTNYAMTIAETLALIVRAVGGGQRGLVCVRRQIIESLLLHQRINAP